MKLALALITLLGVVSPTLAEPKTSFAAQRFFIPMPEDLLFEKTFKPIHKNNNPSSPVHSLISLAISTDNTTVYYDHHEDGYEKDVTKEQKQGTTRIWGDGDCSNGCRPDIDPDDCEDHMDYFKAGDAVVIQEEVKVPRNNDVLYDGGDYIEATRPIAITRGAYPDEPGSLMAGAIEVLDMSVWGTEFKAPIGQDVGKYVEAEAMQYVALYILAGHDDTVVTLPGSTVPLNKGQTTVYRVQKQGDLIKSNYPIMVDLVTGDVGSTYELRWYSLLAKDDWSSEYYSPVGDTLGGTKVLLYNPGNEQITINYQYLKSGSKQYKSIDVNKGKHVMSENIPDDSGAYFKSDGGEKFIGLSLTDTVNTGQIYDWGFPLISREMLTPQVLIGLGYGCTNNDCGSKSERSVVWITPVADANIYVDYNNNGTVDKTIPAKELESIKINDSSDEDMTGAIIFARAANDDNKDVDIAAAWGQNPKYSYSGDDYALDLGTVVLPLTGVQVNKKVEPVDKNKEFINPGDKLLYTIEIVNIGQADIAAGQLTVLDDGLETDQVTYIDNSCTYDAEGTPYDCDDAGNTNFPLDESGFESPAISKRGGTHTITFKVRVKDAGKFIDDKTIINTGVLKQNMGHDLPFKAVCEVVIPDSTIPPEEFTEPPKGSCPIPIKPREVLPLTKEKTSVTHTQKTFI